MNMDPDYINNYHMTHSEPFNHIPYQHTKKVGQAKLIYHRIVVAPLTFFYEELIIGCTNTKLAVLAWF